MRQVARLRLSPALAISLIALFTALSAGAYAAVQLPKNSVHAKQIQDGAVKAAEIADGAVTAAKLADGLAIAASPGTEGPRGPVGSQGPPGPAGADGEPGSAGLGSVVVRYGTEVDVPATGPVAREVSASCEPGEQALGGGALISAAASAAGDRSGEYFTHVVQMRPLTGNATSASGTAPNGWATGVTNTAGQLPAVNDVASHAKAYVICAR